jgi:hypothetical protein
LWDSPANTAVGFDCESCRPAPRLLTSSLDSLGEGKPAGADASTDATAEPDDRAEASDSPLTETAPEVGLNVRAGASDLPQIDSTPDVELDARAEALDEPQTDTTTLVDYQIIRTSTAPALTADCESGAWASVSLCRRRMSQHRLPAAARGLPSFSERATIDSPLVRGTGSRCLLPGAETWSGETKCFGPH